MRKIKVKLFDSFTTKFFGGNIAGVVTEADNLSSVEMLKIASEINAPTTGYVLRKEINHFEVRFFTPSQEIDMCGHVVIGVFMALAEEGKIATKNSNVAYVKQYTKAGLMPVEVYFKNKKPVYVLMKQNQPLFKDLKLNLNKIANLLGIPTNFIETEYPIEWVSTALRHVFIPVKNLKALKELKPNFPALGELSKKINVETIDVFTRETVNSDYNVHSRDFCPGIGNPEEAASGTTNGALACYLLKNKVILNIKDNGKILINAEQGFEMGRPSNIRSEIIVKDKEIIEVKVGGTAVCSLIGEIYLGD